MNINEIKKSAILEKVCLCNSYYNSYVSNYAYINFFKGFHFENNDDININNLKKETDIYLNEYLNLNHYYRFLESINYDIKNNNSFHIGEKKPYISYKEFDTNTYFYIRKSDIKNISVFHIVKILLNSKKINKFVYKETIRRLKYNQIVNSLFSFFPSYMQTETYKRQYNKMYMKHIKQKVISLISAYYGTIKSKRNNNTITALYRQNSKIRDNIFYMKINNYLYSVLLKKKTQNKVFNMDIPINPIDEKLLSKQKENRFKFINYIYSEITKRYKFNNYLIE